MTKQQPEQLLATLLSLEEAGWWALIRGNGADFYEEYLTSDARMVLPLGLLSREQSIAGVKASLPWASFRIEEPRVIVLTEGSAVLVYRATAQRAGQEPYSAWMSTVYVRTDGTWKMAFHQQTPVSA